MAALIHRHQTRLSKLLVRMGGISRDDAVSNAVAQLDTMRSESDDVIEAAIAALESIVKSDKHSQSDFYEMLVLADRIATLAGMFDYKTLDTVTRGFCDLLDGLSRTGRDDPASIKVHIQAMRMTAPRSAALPPEQVELMIAELEKVAARHGFGKLMDFANDLESYESPGRNGDETG